MQKACNTRRSRGFTPSATKITNKQEQPAEDDSASVLAAAVGLASSCTRWLAGPCLPQPTADRAVEIRHPRPKLLAAHTWQPCSSAVGALGMGGGAACTRGTAGRCLSRRSGPCMPHQRMPMIHQAARFLQLGKASWVRQLGQAQPYREDKRPPRHRRPGNPA